MHNYTKHHVAFVQPNRVVCMREITQDKSTCSLQLLLALLGWRILPRHGGSTALLAALYLLEHTFSLSRPAPRIAWCEPGLVLCCPSFGRPLAEVIVCR
ncbi:hypothetical protein Plhal304r1_c028g0092781 [Plasmopara halstedii]